MMNSEHISNDDVWIAIQINDSFLYVNDEPYNVFVLMDAMNAHVFGHVLARVADGAPRESDVSALFDKALAARGHKPKKMIIPDESEAGDVFRAQAEKQALPVEQVPVSELSPVIAPLLEAFAEMEED